MMDSYNDYLKETFQIKKNVPKLKLHIFSDKIAFNEYGVKSISNFSESFYGFCKYGDDPELVVYYDGKYKGIFFHEGLHQFIELVAGDLLTCPQWFNEGLASYLEECDYKSGKIILPKRANAGYYKKCLSLIESDSLITMDRFMLIPLNQWNKSQNDYAIGACLIDFLLNHDLKTARDSFSQFIFTIKETRNYDKALRRSYGNLDYKILDKEFIKWIRKHG